MEHVSNQMLAGFFQDVQRYTANFLGGNSLSKIVIKLENDVDKKMMKGLLNYSFEFIPSNLDNFVEIAFGRAYLTAEYVSSGGEFTFEDFIAMLYKSASIDDKEAIKSIKKALFKESLDYGLAYLRLSK